MDSFNAFPHSGSDANFDAPQEEMSSYSHLKLGKLYTKAARYDEALEQYNMAIALNPNESGFHFYRGIAQFHLGYMTEALQDFQRALEEDPWNTADILNFTGFIRFQNGDSNGAREDLARMLASERIDPSDYKLKGQALTDLLNGQSDDAQRF